MKWRFIPVVFIISLLMMSCENDIEQVKLVTGNIVEPI